jgi:hypothetical protein
MALKHRTDFSAPLIDITAASFGRHVNRFDYQLGGGGTVTEGEWGPETL